MWFKYPYTNFSELNLDWFLSQFKELLEKWDAQKVDYEQFKLDVTTEFNTLSGKFDNLKDAFDDLKTFIENYFDDLDVQQEINNKLNEMVSDGTMAALLAPLVTAQVPSAVSSWLTENVDPVGSAVVVDSSLSISGAAADAEVVGDKLDYIEPILEDLKLEVDGELPVDLDYEMGSYFANNGFASSTTRIRAAITSGKYLFTPSSDIYYSVVYYDSDSAGTNLVSLGSITTPITLNITRLAYITIQYRDSSTITTAAASELTIKEIYSGDSYKDRVDLLENEVEDQLMPDLDDLKLYIYGQKIENLSFEQGSFLQTGFGTSTIRIRAKLDPGIYIITPSNDIYYAIYYYDSDSAGTALVTLGSITGTAKIAVERDAYITLQFRDSSTMTPANGDEIQVIYYISDPLADMPELMDSRVAEVKNKALSETFDHLIGRTEYFVGKDQTYTTINAALTAWAADSYPPANVYISNGEYNEVVEINSKDIALIGESRDGTIIRTTSGRYVDAPVHILHGNVTIANMTIIADHTGDPNFNYETVIGDNSAAYGIHIDGGTVAGKVVVKNCTVVSYQSPAFGMGTIPGSVIRIENCDAYCYTDFTSNTSSKQYRVLQYGCVLCHMSSTSLYPDRDTETLELVATNMFAKNTRNVIKLNHGNDLTEHMNVLAINNSLASGATNDRNTLFVPDTNDLVILDSTSQGNTCSSMNYSE